MSFPNHFSSPFSLGAMLFAALIATSLIVPSTAAAQRHHGGGFSIFMGHPDHVARKLDHMLDHLDATDAQRAEITQIVQVSVTDMETQREASKALREQAMQLFMQADVDANAVETLRQQMMQQIDQLSQRATLVMLDASRVLTLEQRTKLAQHMKRRHKKSARRWH